MSEFISIQVSKKRFKQLDRECSGQFFHREDKNGLVYVKAGTSYSAEIFKSYGLKPEG